MRLIKLALISAVIFYLLIWAITMLFPNVTIVSRAINIAGSKDVVAKMLRSNEIPYQSWLTSTNPSVNVLAADVPFYENNLFNADRQENADTIFFEMRHQQKPFLYGGIGLYQLYPDSATTQLYYVFRTHWYKPWEKMAQVANDAKYGGQMDAALLQLKMAVETK